MALQKPILKLAVLQAINDAKSKTDNPDQAINALADALTDAIDTYIRSATVTVLSGIPVTVVPATGVGATTLPGTGGLS